jgi:hypothetical protein
MTFQVAREAASPRFSHAVCSAPRMPVSGAGALLGPLDPGGQQGRLAGRQVAEVRRVLRELPRCLWGSHRVRQECRDLSDVVGQAIQALVEEGPSLGRPLVDRVKRAALHNLKELRPGSSGSSEIRILFIFDPERNAVLLTAGDKETGA